MFTIAALATVQNQAPSTPGLYTSLLLLLIVTVILIVIGSVLIREIGMLATVTVAAVTSMFANLRALIVLLFALLLVLALEYTGGDKDGASTPPSPSTTQSSTPNVTR